MCSSDLLQGREDFRAVFGTMLQSPPVGMLNGRIRIQGWTVSGTMTAQAYGDVQFAFGIRRVESNRQL